MHEKRDEAHNQIILQIHENLMHPPEIRKMLNTNMLQSEPYRPKRFT